MRTPTSRFLSFTGAVSLAVLSAATASADDRQLLYTSTSAAPNVMVIISNTETMANCVPNAPLPNGGTCSNLASPPTPLAFDGMADGPTSKMGVAKAALTNIIRLNPTAFNWGISSYLEIYGNFQDNTKQTPCSNASDCARKRYVFQAQSDDFPAAGFNTPALTLVNFGGNPPSLSFGPYMTVAWQSQGRASWLQSLADAAHKPFGGPLGATPVILYNLGAGISLNGKTDAGKEIVFTIVSSTYAAGETNHGPYRIHFDDGDKFTVQENVYQCGLVPLAAAANPPSCGAVIATASVDYKIPVGYCSEANSNCAYPTVYGTGPEAREQMGWTKYDEMNQPQNAQNSWTTQENTCCKPQPIVMIPHPYSPWMPSVPKTGPIPAQRTYAQTGNPCLLRALRPASAVYDNTANTTQGLPAEHDYFPLSNPALSTAPSAGQCDLFADGLYQTQHYHIDPITFQPSSPTTDQGNDHGELIPSIFSRTLTADGVPILKTLKSAATYFYGADLLPVGATLGAPAAPTCSLGFGVAGSVAPTSVDNFSAGKRCDDPSSAGGCRTNAIILVTDSFNASRPKFVWGDAADPTGMLQTLKIPVFVIGFAVQASSVPITDNPCTLGDGTTSTHIGKCVADYTGATTYKNGVVDRKGYYDASDQAGLAAAFAAITSQLDTRPRDFATAVVPSASAASESLAYLSQFSPRNNRSVWSGRLRAFFLDPTTGLVQTNGDGTPSTIRYDFSSGTGSLVWEAGNTAQDLPTGLKGALDGVNRVNATAVLAAGTPWSDAHDQATGIVGRNVFFGLRPGDPGCSSTSYECLVQIPAGASGTPPAPPGTLPSWWANVRDSSSYAGVPGTVPETGNNRDQALQNSFSFIRGNRDVVVENLKISSKFTATNSTCASLLSDTASPCYYGEILGDIFHSNPVIVSFPENTRYKLAQDAGSAVPGAYSDRGKSYGTFFTDHRRRRKILYSGADDAYLHAVDAGVFNADTASFPGQYSLGSGREIFGYAPRSAVQKVYQLTHTIVQDWTVDGAPAFDDVFVDVTRAGATPAGVLSSESCAPSCTDSTHAWRTVVVGVTREAGTPVTPGSGGGGGVVFALDVTDPDLPANMNETASGGAGAPQCLVNSFTPGSSSPPAGCSSPFPRILWELADNQASSSVAPQPAEGILSLQSTTQDLGHTWSRPVIGRIKVKVGSQNTDFFVAIFGGGYSHTGASLAETNVSGGTGNFLYMADIETGKIIYKRNLGSFASNASATVSTGNLPAGAPGEPGVVDINFDGYVDRVFIGDTQGRLWKVDISSPADLVGGLIASSQWNPTLFFDEYQATTAADFAAKFPGQVRQPIFGRPSIFPIGTTGTGNAKLGVAVGTGDRDNMPALTDTRNNSFLVVVDEPGTITYPVFQFKSGGGSDLTAASFTLPTPCTAANCLNGKGYYLTLPVGSGGAQIVNTNPLVFNRVIYFNAFLRGTSVSACGSPGGKAFIYKVDFATGLSLILDTNGNPVLPSAETGDTMVASDPIIFDSKVGSALSDTSFKQIGGGQPPTVKVKSWKEQ